jgi:hypothetical protein
MAEPEELLRVLRAIPGNGNDASWAGLLQACEYLVEIITSNLYPIEVFEQFCSFAEAIRALEIPDQVEGYTVPSLGLIDGEVVDVYYPAEGYATDQTIPTMNLLGGYINGSIRIQQDYTLTSMLPINGTITQGVIGFAPDECINAVAFLIDDQAGPFFFYPRYDVYLNCEYESNVVVVPTDLVGELTASVTGGWIRRYREGSWTAWGTSVTVQATDWIQLKVQAASIPGTTATAVMTLGEYTAAFSVLTVSCEIPENFIVFPDRIKVALSTWIVSVSLEIPLCLLCGQEISVTNGEYSIDSGTGYGPWTAVAGQVLPEDRVRVRGMSSDLYSTQTVVTLTIGAESGTFTITTVAEGEEPLNIAEIETVSVTIVDGVFPAYVNVVTLTAVNAATNTSAEAVTLTTVNSASVTSAETVTLTAIILPEEP